MQADSLRKIVTDSAPVYTKVVNTIDSVLDALSKRFGATGAHLWEIMVRQVYVVALQDSIETLIAGIFTVWCYKTVRKLLAIEGSRDSDHVLMVFATIGFVIGLFATCLYGSSAIPEISQLINPEYGALQNVFNLIHGK